MYNKPDSVNSANFLQPPQPAERSSKVALILAAAVHLLLLGALFFGVQWKSKQDESIAVELWSAPPPIASAPPIEKTPPVEPSSPKTPPKAMIKNEPPPEPPQVNPDIAIKEKKKKEEEKRKKEDEEKRKQEADRKKKAAEEQKEKAKDEENRKKDAEDKRKKDEQKEKDRKEKAADDLRKRNADALTKELADIRKAESDKRHKESMDNIFAQAGQEGVPSAGRPGAAGGNSTKGSDSRAQYADAIKRKVRSNIVLPGNLNGNPEAIFKVIQLPSGEILDVKLSKSSGNVALDAAIERAILKSSPLPLPVPASLFERELILKLKPFDAP